MTMNTTVAHTTFLEEPALRPIEQRVQATVEENFDALVEQYSAKAYNISLRMLRNPQDAEDAVQEAFLSAYRALPNFKGQSKLSTWFYRIVVNAALLKIRKDKTRGNYLSDTGYEDQVVPNWENDPEKAAINGELRDAIEAGLEQLPPTLRAAVVLRMLQGFSNPEAAGILGIGIPAFKARLHRGNVLLRKHLERRLATPLAERA